jgi:hypothetical protein
VSKSFTDYSYDDAANLVGSKVNLPRDGTRDYPLPAILESFASISPRRPVTRRTQTALDATELYFGNHWLDSRGFIGQLPPRGLPGYASMIADIRKGFVADNVIKEVVKTHVGGILGREPSWSFLVTEEDDPEGQRKEFSKETGNTLTRWWNDRKALKDLQKATRILVCEGTVVRRLFFPRGRLNQGTVSASSLLSALDFIYFETVYADQGGVFTDPETMRDIGIFLFDEFDAKGDVKTHCAELSFLNDAGETVCKIVRDEGAPTEYAPYPLGGRLLVYEMTRDALITEQIQTNQRALNLAHTQMIRNVNLAGNRERTITNAQPPLPKTDKPTVTADTVRTADGRFPGTYKTGAGAVNFVMGVPIHDEDGNIVGYTNPGVNVSEPVSVETFKETISQEKEAIYAQAHQRHVLIVDKADTSGRAREVARREYERSLKESKTEVDACGRWQLETTLRLAAFFIGESSRYLPLRADFNTLIDAGAPDPEQQQMALQMRQPGGMKNRPLISDETARGLSGIEDNAAEETRIDKESTLPEAKLPENPQAVQGQQTPKPVSNAVN